MNLPLLSRLSKQVKILSTNMGSQLREATLRMFYILLLDFP
jgi:hypothetical protein